MIQHSKVLYKTMIATSAVCFCLFGFTSAGIGGESHKQDMTKESDGQHEKDNLQSDQRIVYGTVEGVSENTIKVNYGEVGEMSPRYLELEKLEGKVDSVKQGDRVKITVNNSDNKVINYELANKKH